MTLGQKIRAGRTAAGLTQQEMAEKLSVSRQAVTKWEADRGIPDVVNLQALAALFGITVDDLLRDDLVSGPGAVTEEIDARSYRVEKPARHRFDAAVRAAFPDADVVQPLVRSKRLRGWRFWLDLLVQPGVVGAHEQLSDFAGFFLVEQRGQQLLVRVTDTTLTRRPPDETFTGRRLVLGDDVLRRAPYRL
ncbi:helix-turn-helix transcriptional regulator [Nocardioides jishulii]|uniref:helix-turn-helix transcriptional regulator n=1 Tax=Nocardioides jishulii TaxID=2575440 RepID=UPI001BB04A3F|nr:helix-turn-helix domain-containing protein [Nocardioides jishulii]